MFATVLADHNWPQTINFPVSSICLFKSHKVLLFHYHEGNSHVIVNALLPFSNLNASIKILLLFIKGVMF